MHKWSNAGRAVKSVHKLPPEVFSHHFVALGGNLLAGRGSQNPASSLTFARVPSAATQKPIEWRSIPPFHFTINGIATHIPDNVLAVAEQWGQYDRR